MNNIINFKELKDFCMLISEMFSIQILFTTRGGAVTFESCAHYIKNPSNPSYEGLFKTLPDAHDTWDFPFIIDNSYFENSMIINVHAEKIGQDGYIVVGPSTEYDWNGNVISKIAVELGTEDTKDALISYYKSLPKMSKEKLIEISLLIHFFIYKEKVDKREIIQKNLELHNQKIDERLFNLSISENRQRLFSHINPLIEQKLLQCIREGQTKELNKVLEQFPKGDELNILSKSNFLRSVKNIAIVSITLATRAAVEGGLFYEEAYTLSDLYIKTLEDLQDSKSVVILMESAFYDFAERVSRKNQPIYSKPIFICKEYIFNHVYEDLSVTTLAEHLNLHPSYLSQLFKKEVGLTLSEYIQRTKIEEAKNLIQFSNYSLSEIYTLLNFNDQSYFTKVFKKVTGFTPSHFKSNA